MTSQTRQLENLNRPAGEDLVIWIVCCRHSLIELSQSKAWFRWSVAVWCSVNARAALDGLLFGTAPRWCDGISAIASVRLLAIVSVQVGTALIPLASVLASAGTALMRLPAGDAVALCDTCAAVFAVCVQDLECDLSQTRGGPPLIGGPPLAGPGLYIYMYMYAYTVRVRIVSWENSDDENGSRQIPVVIRTLKKASFALIIS